MLGSRRGDLAVPIASVAKVMTAYVVLRDHPFGPRDSGPPITVTPADVATYQTDVATGQSVAPVASGERLSERQALEEMLLPSANNVATMLASWDAGSLGAFVAKMNDWARMLRLRRTRYADASGVDSATVSSADDQARLAAAALRIPVFAQIVSMRQARLPVAGVLFNRDALLGRDGVFGVKPGSTSAAGGCFVFAAHERVDAQAITVIGAVLGQPATPARPTILLEAALQATTKLLRSIPHVLEIARVGPSTPLASVHAPWTHPVAAGPSRVVSFVGWPGLRVRVRIASAPILRAPMRPGQEVAVADMSAGDQRQTVPVVVTRELASPSLWWRLAHP
jgi:D-alanyl-D-alanine carboxypeptidase (penicillin-binding protein 5/6)